MVFRSGLRAGINMTHLNREALAILNTETRRNEDYNSHSAAAETLRHSVASEKRRLFVIGSAYEYDH